MIIVLYETDSYQSFISMACVHNVVRFFSRFDILKTFFHQFISTFDGNQSMGELID